MKKITTTLVLLASLALNAASLPATRTYVETRMTEEAQYRRTGDALLLGQIAAMDATLALVRVAVDNLATNLQNASSTLTTEQLTALTGVIGNVSSNLSLQATQLQDALHTMIDTAAAVHYATNWSDRCVIDLGVLTPAASNEYRLATWPTMRHDRRVRQYMASFSIPTDGFLMLPQGTRTDTGNLVRAGQNVIMCTDMNDWFFVQLRNLED